MSPDIGRVEEGVCLEYFYIRVRNIFILIRLKPNATVP